MPRKFEKFPELLDWRRYCPVCKDELKYEISMYDVFLPPTSTQYKNPAIAKIERYLSGAAGEQVRTTKQFTPTTCNDVELENTKVIFKFGENKCSSPDLESAMDVFDLKIYCEKDIVGEEYVAKGSFDIYVDFTETDKIDKENDRFILPFDNIKINYETYKISNIHLEDEKPNGNLIKVTNDFTINKTSFSMAEVNLDGTMGTWKEKRIDLVDDKFFKFDNSEKIYSRINAIFLLK